MPAASLQMRLVRIEIERINSPNTCVHIKEFGSSHGG